MMNPTEISQSERNSFDSGSAEPVSCVEARLKDRLGGLKIVVVEDTPDARKLIGLYLSKAGAHVYSVSSAEEARELLRHFRPDLIVSDIGMPEEDGITFMRHLRASEHDSGRHVPAIALTAYVGLEHRNLTLRAGFEGHLCKPVSPDILINTIRDVLLNTPHSGHH